MCRFAVRAIRSPERPPLVISRRVPISGILSGLSAALDITEGHPRGHAARSCLIGMRIADALRLSPEECSDLFYASLLKDAGCSSNAERVYQMFGGPDEHETKRAVWLRDWRKLNQKVRYALDWVEPEGDFVARVRQFLKLASIGPKAEKNCSKSVARAAPPSRARSACPRRRPGRCTRWTNIGMAAAIPKA